MTTHEGSCHCGAVKLTLPSTPEVATDCNCSLCRRIGGPWVYYAFGTVAIASQPDALVGYVQRDGTLRTMHCRTCGCVTHWEPVVAKEGGKHGVVLGNFDPALIAAVRVRKFDGADTWRFLDEEPSGDADAWESRLAALWRSLPDQAPDRFLQSVQELVDELPADDATGLFERASAQDSTGRSDRAVPLYRAALAKGLVGARRRRATVQLASSLRNTGRAAEALALLESEALEPDDELDSAVAAFHALALSDLGREREGLGRALTALSHHLPRYNASLARYATELVRDTGRSVPPITLDHFVVPSLDPAAAAERLGTLLGVPWEAQGAFGPFSAVHVHGGLTIDFDQWASPIPKLHCAFRVDDAAFDAILARLRAEGLSIRSTPNGPDDGVINPAFGGRLVYWSEPDGHVWEMLTVRYGSERPAT